MSEDLSIQQRPSAVPYALGGAATAGAVTYFGAPHIEPVKKFLKEGEGKYNSFDDLVKEANDKDSFKSSIEKAEGEAKTTMEKLQQKVSEAEAKYEADLTEALKAASESATELPADHELLKEQTRLQNALDTKRQTLIDQEVAKLQAEAAKKAKDPKAVKVLEDKIKAAAEAHSESIKNINQIVDDLAQQRTSFLNGFESNASFHSKQGRESFQRIIDKQNKEIAEWVNSLKDLSKEQKKQLLEEVRIAVDNKVAINTYNNATVNTSLIENAKNRAEGFLREYQSKLSDSNSSIKEKIAEYLASPNEPANQKFMERLLTAEKSKLTKLQGIEKVMSEMKPDDIQEIFKLIAKDTYGNEVGTLELIKQKTGGALNLSKDELATLKRLVGNENATLKQVQSTLEGLKNNITNIESSTTTLNTLKPAVEKAQIKAPELVTAVNVPEPSRLTGLRKSLEKLGASGLTPEQIKEQAAKNIDDAASTLLKDEKGALDDIVNKIKEEIAKLPKEGGKTAEEITKEFVEKNGEKAEYVKKALEGSKDDFSSLIGGINKTKLAWVTAGVALVGALIATAMRPSGKDA